MMQSTSMSLARAALVACACLMLGACGAKARCDDPEAVAQMLKLASRGVVDDLATQCATSLHEQIPAVAGSCPARGEPVAPGCAAACRRWATGAVEARATQVETVFTDDTIATRSCRASVRFDVAFAGGQTVVAKIAYLVAPLNRKLKVVLSQ
jgi:hypothetical protein